jgi:hypothetical protein
LPRVIAKFKHLIMCIPNGSLGSEPDGHQANEALSMKLTVAV